MLRAAYLLHGKLGSIDRGTGAPVRAVDGAILGRFLHQGQIPSWLTRRARVLERLERTPMSGGLGDQIKPYGCIDCR